MHSQSVGAFAKAKKRANAPRRLAASLGMTLEQMDALDSVEEAAQGMEDEYLEAFQKFDADGSGDVSPEELKAVLMSTEEGITDEELDKLVAEADVDGDGTISYEEFVRMMKARKTIAALASTQGTRRATLRVWPRDLRVNA